MKVEQLALSKIRPYPGNPRIPRDAVEKVRHSLRAFGWRQPLVLDADGFIVVGHVRYQAALEEGLKSAPVHRAEDLSPEQARAYRIMDNRSHQEAEWDREALSAEVAALESAGVSLADTGFDEEELHALVPFDLFVGQTDEDDVPESPRRARAKEGDLFTLGPHRVLCGDATRPSDVAKLLDGKPADACITDPPYNVDVDGAAGKIQNDHMAAGDFRDFLRKAFRSLHGGIRPGAPVYVFHGESEGLAFRRAFQTAGLHLSGALIWVKDSATLSRSDYQWRHEPVLYGWREGAKRTWNGGRDKTSVLEFPRPRRSEEHPTMKPVELLSALLGNSTGDGDVVLDLFGGSGSTLVACHLTARVARILELDPAFVDVICRRWQEYTGESALRSDGVAFNDI